MSSIVRRSSDVSVLRSDTDNFYGTLTNIRASADNSAVVAASSAAIEKSTAATAQNTARLLFQQMETNLKLDQGLQLQNLQVRLALSANEELRSIDSTVRTLSQTVADVGTDLKQIGRESNTLLQQANDVLGQSLGVQTELLNAIKSEHARLELDRKAKRLIYELEHVAETVKAETSPVVQAFAASMMLHQTGAAGFSLDDVFEVADKRTLDNQRKELRAMIDGADAGAKEELARFDDTCRRYFQAIAVDPLNGFAPPQRQQHFMPDVDTNESILPPIVGDRAMTQELATKLNGILVTLHEKRNRAKGFYIIAGVITGLFAVMSIAIMFSMPAFGIILLMLFAAGGLVLMVSPLGVRLATSMTGIDMDVRPERAFLLDMSTTEAGAAEAVAAWAEHLRKVQTLRKSLAIESASVKKTNERIRQSNAVAASWNERRTALITAVRAEQKKNVGDLRNALEAFIAKYPSLRQWWTLPDAPAA